MKTCRFDFMVLRGKKHGNVFWTRGGEYGDDWYELLFESDDEEEVKNYCHFKYYGFDDEVRQKTRKP